MYLLAIVLHTLAGVVAFGLGCAVIRPPTDVRGQLFRSHFIAIVGLVVFLIAAIASHWASLAPTTRVVYAILTGLGLFMIWRAWRAATTSVQDAGYVAHVGFTLISLFEGFVIVAALDLGSPVWLVIAIAVAGVLVGRWAVGRVEASVTTGAPGRQGRSPTGVTRS